MSELCVINIDFLVLMGDIKFWVKELGFQKVGISGVDLCLEE